MVILTLYHSSVRTDNRDESGGDMSLKRFSAVSLA